MPRLACQTIGMCVLSASITKSAGGEQIKCERSDRHVTKLEWEAGDCTLRFTWAQIRSL
jgi:hypothetical protein